MILTAAEAVILYRGSTKAYCIILFLYPNILNLMSLILLLQCVCIWFGLVMGSQHAMFIVIDFLMGIWYTLPDDADHLFIMEVYQVQTSYKSKC